MAVDTPPTRLESAPELGSLPDVVEPLPLEQPIVEARAVDKIYDTGKVEVHAFIFLAVYAVAMLTTLAPARRASRIFPAEALRYQ